jgi:glucose-1-phosphate cytidylyltransferase
MKVVLFCGGLGMRLREYSETVPKPMVPVGAHPVIWHVMRYYAHFGHREFVLCLGHGGRAIREFFLGYREELYNDMVMHDGGARIELLRRDMSDWTIHFVETGLNANIGERLAAVRHLVEGDEVFLANYSDGLTDFPLPRLVDRFVAEPRAVAGFVAVPPPGSYHVVRAREDFVVERIQPIGRLDWRINGGYFVLRPAIFEHLHPGEELVEAPFQRLIAEGRLMACPYDGFWAPMDTFKDKNFLDGLHASGRAPWELWKAANGSPG